MKLFLVPLLVACAAVAFAQSNYHKGYVVKSNGDTVKGYIDYREWSQCPLAIKFKFQEDDPEPVHFDPHTIMAFDITGMETYRTYKGAISMNKTSFPDLPSRLDTSKKIDTIFIRQVSRGKYLTLFYHSDKRKTRFFIAEKDAEPVELNYAQYYQNNHDVVVSSSYRNLLIYYIQKYAPGNDMLIHQAQTVEYTEAGLENLVSSLNGDTKTNKTKPNARLFVGGGINFVTAEVLTTNNSYYPSPVSPTINAGVDVFVNPDVQQLVLRAQLSLWYVNSSIPLYTNASVQQFNATITPQLLFNFYNSDNLKWYIDAGWSFSFSAISSSGLPSQGASNPSGAKWSNFPLQIGVTINKSFDISLQYTGYGGYIDFPSFAMADKAVGVGIKYFIPKK